MFTDKEKYKLGTVWERMYKKRVKRKNQISVALYVKRWFLYSIFSFLFFLTITVKSKKVVKLVIYSLPAFFIFHYVLQITRTIKKENR